MRNCQQFRGIPSWHPILLASDDDKVRSYSDPEIRRRLHAEAVEWSVEVPEANVARNWYDYMWVDEPVLEKNRWMKDRTIAEVAKEQGKGIIDAFLDLSVEENLETTFIQGENNVDKEAVTKILNFPSAIVGLSDGGGGGLTCSSTEAMATVRGFSATGSGSRGSCPWKRLSGA